MSSRCHTRGYRVKTKSVTVRLSEPEIELLAQVAASKKTNKSELLRSYMHECMSGFDRKHQVMLGEIQALRREYEATRNLAASAVGALALLNVQRHNAAAIQDIKKNLDESFGLAEAVGKLMAQFGKEPTGGL